MPRPHRILALEQLREPVRLPALRGAVPAVAAAAMLASCLTLGGGVPLQASPAVPAASGMLRVSTDRRNQNVVVRLTVEHLAEPSRLSPPANVYVVWIRPAEGDGPVQNAGALAIGKNLSGRLQMVTPHKNFSLFVTAEDLPTLAEPAGRPLLWANVDA